MKALGYGEPILLNDSCMDIHDYLFLIVKMGVSIISSIISAAQGQRIYTLTKSNAEQLINITIDEGARQEIQTALDNDNEVLVHQSPVSEFGWSGSGYMIIDPDSGAGAYKISGGANGGFLSDDLAGFLTAIGFAAGSLSSFFTVLILGVNILAVTAVVITALLIVDLILDYDTLDEQCKIGMTKGLIGLAILAGIVGAIFLPPLLAIVALYTGLLAGSGTISVLSSLDACKK
mgnify:CR=1 FL=1